MCDRCAALDRRAFALGAVALAGLGLVGCTPETGPVSMKYGRDMCDLCRMIISEPRFAAQVRGGPKHAAFKFDDLGDAILFVLAQDWRESPATEFWVGDSEATEPRWLEARAARYRTGVVSPMDYGFAAVAAAGAAPDAVDFETVVRTVAKLGPSGHCPIPTAAPAAA